MFKSLKYIAITLLGITLLLFVGSFFIETSDPEEESIIIIEQIRQVCKIITTEGTFVENYSYKEPTTYGSTMFSVTPQIGSYFFKKEAHLKIKANIGVGYDFTEVIYDVDLDTKLIILSNVPSNPEIMFVEHELLDFDNESYMVRPLSDNEIVDLQNAALDQIMERTDVMLLYEEAAKEHIELIHLLQTIALDGEWGIQINYVQNGLDQ
jgi:hypothetical protein